MTTVRMAKKQKKGFYIRTSLRAPYVTGEEKEEECYKPLLAGRLKMPLLSLLLVAIGNSE